MLLLLSLLFFFSFPGYSSSSGSFFSPGYVIRNNFRGSKCTNSTMFEQTITRLGECHLVDTGTAYFSQMLSLDLLAASKYTYSIQQNVYNNYSHCNSSSASSASFAACASDSQCTSSYILYDTFFSFVSGVCTTSSGGLDSFTQTVVATNSSAFVQVAEPVLGSSEWSLASRKGYARFAYSSSACTGRYLQASLLVDGTCQGALAEAEMHGNANQVSQCNAHARTVITKQYSNSSFCVHAKGSVTFSNYSFVPNTCTASAMSSLSEPLQGVSSLFSSSSCYEAPTSSPTSSPPPPPPYPTAAPTTAAPNSMAPSHTTPAGLIVLFTGYLVIDNFDSLNCSSSSQYQQSIQTFDGNCVSYTGGSGASPYVKPFLYTQKNKYGFGGLLYTDALCSNYSVESPLERSYDKKNDLSTTYLYKNDVCYVSSSGTGSWRMSYLNSASTPTAPLLSPALLGLQKYVYASKDTCSISSSSKGRSIDSAYAYASVIVNGKCQGGLSQELADERLVCDASKVSRSAFSAGTSCKGTATVTSTLGSSAYSNCALESASNEYTTVSCFVGPTTSPTPAPSSSKPSTALPTAAPFVMAANSNLSTALSPGVVSGVAAVLILVACCVINFTCLRYVDTCNLEARREKAWRDAHAPPEEEESGDAWKDVDADAGSEAEPKNGASEADSDVRVSMAEMYNPMRSSSFVSVNLNTQLPLETKADECSKKVKASAAARAAQDQIPAQPIRRGSAFDTFVNPFFGNKGLSAKKEMPRGQGISTSAIRAQIASPSSTSSPPPPPPPSSAAAAASSSSSTTSSTNPFA